MMDHRRPSGYRNSAYKRNSDDMDDNVDSVSQHSQHSYGSGETTFIEDLYLEDTPPPVTSLARRRRQRLEYGPECGGVQDTADAESDFDAFHDCLAAFDESHIGNRSFSLQQMARYPSAVQRTSTDSDAGTYVYDYDPHACVPHSLTSTPKKPSSTRAYSGVGLGAPATVAPQHRRRPVLVRRRSISAPGRRSYRRRVPATEMYRCTPTSTAPLRRSFSSLSLQTAMAKAKAQHSYYGAEEMIALRSLPTTPAKYHTYVDVGNRTFHTYPDPVLGLPIMTALSTPTKSTHFRRPRYAVHKNTTFLRRPYDSNSSSSSTRPLLSSPQRNMAVISPISQSKPINQQVANKLDENDNSQENEEDSFEERSKVFTIAADRSPCSSKLNSWIHVTKQTMPKCTLRSAGFALMLCGTISCLLCFKVMMIKGKRLDLTISLLSSFITICVGFTCLWIQRWKWLPNRNYVSGYILLSLFSAIQSVCLWILDRLQLKDDASKTTADLNDLMKGTLYGISGLTMTLVTLGVISTSCCKHPPPDNRVAHAVEGFSV